MSILKNGSPQQILYGVDDQSIAELVPQPAGKPIHLPLLFTFSSMGDHTEAFQASGDAMFKMYGTDILDYKSPYATINTPFMALFNANANDMLIQRVVPDDATDASLRLYVEVVPVADAPVYERNADGSVVYDSETGEPKTTGTKAGVQLIWRTGKFSDLAGQYKNGNIIDGTVGAGSKVYPIADLPASCIGARYNRKGLVLSCLNAKTTPAVDADYTEAVGGRLLNIQFMDQIIEGQSPSIEKTINGATEVMTSLLPDAYHEPTRLDLDFDEVVVGAYRDLQPDPGFLPTLGAVKDFYLYRANIETVLTETAVAIGLDASEIYMADIFTGMDPMGHLSDGVTIDDGTNGGVSMTAEHVHYLDGGSDGTMTAENFDLLVRRELMQLGESYVPYLNILKYPFSAVWDAGFSTDTKAALSTVVSRLKTTNVFRSTHIATEGQNDIATEEAMKVAILEQALSTPESTYYGTSQMRSINMGHSMKLTNHSYKDFVPASYILADMVSKYAGAGNGKLKASARFTRGELTIIDSVSQLNLSDKPRKTYSSDWETGLINIQSYDQYRYFIPALYTVYPFDRSVCNNMFVSIISASLNYVAQTIWAEMSGASDLSEAQIIKMYKEKFIAKTAGKYDGVVDVVAVPYFTAEDRSNGYSLTVDIELYGEVLKTVHKTTVRAFRRAGGDA